MTYNEVGFVLVAVVMLAASLAWSRGGADRWVPVQLLLLAVVARIVGSLLRYELLFDYYDGFGDATRYYRAGLARANELWANPLALLTPSYWSLRGSTWGTGFVEQVSGIVVALTGETMRGGFLVFAMLAFVGMYLMVRAYAETHARRRVVIAATWIWLWPSLWYWPSSMGKEALVLLAFGLTTYGYVSGGARASMSLLGGVVLAYLVRPHVATLLVFSIIVAEVVATVRGRLTPRRLLQIAVVILVAAYVVQGTQARLGLHDIDLEGVAEVAAWYSEQTERGGSSIGQAPSGALAPAQAFVNVLLRPFPWEAHNLTSTLAALEVLLFVVLIWRQRDYVYRALWRWHRDPLLRFAVPLIVSYTLMIGLTFANLGIIARQRSPMLPFLFLFFAGAEDPLFVRRRKQEDPGDARRAAAGGRAPDGLTRPVPS